MGCVPASGVYLANLRTITQREKTLLIFDEVMTGFRVAYGGAQELFGVTPDLTMLGKIIGGGMPVGAYGGRKQIMKQVSPAGTLSGNPVAMACGIATLKTLRDEDPYPRLADRAARLGEGIAAAATRQGF